jgi:hypothetical protein
MKVGGNSQSGRGKFNSLDMQDLVSIYYDRKSK